MSDTIRITEDFFNRIELHETFRVDPDGSMWFGGRTIERRRDGTIVRDETHWNVRAWFE